MLKNYFKIAIAVLKRRKFFTFISLFGISFTLTILMVLTAFFDNLLSSNYPDQKRDKTLYVTTVVQRNPKNGYMNTSPASFYFLDHFAGSLKTPAKLSISSIFSATNTYVNNKKLVINVKYTNGAYWDVLDYEFTEGKPYTKQQVENSDRVAIISEETKKNYFGDVASVVGKYIETDNELFRVIGVVKNVPVTMLYSYADMYVPYTLSKTDYRSKILHGMYIGIFLPESPDDIETLQSEFQQMVAKIPMKDRDKEYPNVSVHADPYAVTFTRSLFGNETDSGLGMVILAASIVALMLLLLPTLNLININVSRIMERSSEIGVRKAFGASSNTLVFQFLVENMILTVLGGLIGIALTLAVLSFINSSNLIENIHLQINLTVLGFSLLACFIFGLFSGVYPAWRMSRMHVVSALKAQS